MATWPVVSGNPTPSTNLNELNQRISNTVEAIAVDEVSAGEATASTSYTDLATAGPAVTVTCPSSKALVFLSSFLRNNTAGERAIVSFSVTGASTVAASDARNLSYESSNASDAIEMSQLITLTNLSTGSNTFTMKYRATAGTATYDRRRITVFPLGG